MMKKIKLSDAAKDLSVSAQDLIGYFAGKGDTKKKAGSNVTEEEMNLLLEHYSQTNTVSNFDGYFATRNQPRPVMKSEKEVAVKAEEKKADVKQPQKPAENKQPQKSAENKRAQKPADNKSQQRPTENKQPQKPADSRPQPRPTENRQPQKPVATAAKPVQKAMPKPSEIKASAPKKPIEKTLPKKQEHGERKKLNVSFDTASDSAPAATAQRRTVDTRGSYIELDKYNERYEQIAPVNKHRVGDNFSSKKQKINQKSAQKGKPAHVVRETEVQKLRRLELERARRKQLEITIPDIITVGELASRLKVTATDVIKKLFALGIMATINQELDFDTAAIIAEEAGAKFTKEIVMTIEERLIDDDVDDEGSLKERAPVVVVMGHVDHGKTSILDKIRNAKVTATEAGGITQHIGAYRIKHSGKSITFLDTPGHEAFTSMRARGANITDIAILVVAADDGIMPQTVESINHAKAAGVSIIVAINKMDKESANPERIKQELTEHELVCEEWGGDIICVPVSAKTGMGIDDLIENILLVAEIRELKANPDRLAKGTVIEARLDKGRGPIATILVQNGTLRTGDTIIAGTAVGRVRVMTNHNGKPVKKAGPSVPVEITGLAEVPSAGDIFNAVENERLAKELVEQRKHEAKEELFKAYKKVTLDNLFSHISEGDIKELPIIVKADVQGSVEAVKQSLEKIGNDEVRVRVIHGGVGAVKESDVMLANASNAIIVGFNVTTDPIAAESANRDGVDVRLYRIIYDAIDELTTAMKGMLAPKFREVNMARIEVRNVFKITNVGTVAGCYILSGKVTRHCEIRVVRDGVIVAVDKIDSLKRFKDDVKDVAEGYECGISLNKFSDIKDGDIFEAFVVEEYRED